MKNKKTLVIVISVIMNILFIYWWYEIGFAWTKMLRYVLLLNAMLYLAYIDAKEKIVPGRVLKWLLLFRAFILAAELLSFADIRSELALSAIGGFVMGGLLMLLAYLLSHKGLGAGDVKIIAVVGSYVGSSNVYAVIIFSLLFASIYGIAGMALKKVKLKDEIAFVPFVTLSCIIIMMLGM